MRIALAAGAVAVAGALFSAPWPLGMGCVVTLTALALHPALTGGRSPRAQRLLLRTGLLALMLAVLAQVRSLAVWRTATTSAAFSEILALHGDAGTAQARTARALAHAGLLLLACAAFSVALLRHGTRSALTGLALLVLVAGAAAASAVTERATSVAPGVTERRAVSAVSVTTGVDPAGAARTGIMLFAAYAIVTGSREPPRLRR